MFDAKSIRPVALGVAIRDGKLLVMEGFDEKKGTHFYRCLGGGIEYGEKSDEALRREFMEEISLDIKINDFLGVDENIFTYNGKLGHELVFLYDIDIADKDYKEEYPMIENGKTGTAVWIDVEDFKKREKLLYPYIMYKFL